MCYIGDLEDKSEQDNGGKFCMDIYAFSMFRENALLCFQGPPSMVLSQIVSGGLLGLGRLVLGCATNVLSVRSVLGIFCPSRIY